MQELGLGASVFGLSPGLGFWIKMRVYSLAQGLGFMVWDLEFMM